MNQCSGSLHLIPCFCFPSLLLMKDTEEHCQLIYGFVHYLKSTLRKVLDAINFLAASLSYEKTLMFTVALKFLNMSLSLPCFDIDSSHSVINFLIMDRGLDIDKVLIQLVHKLLGWEVGPISPLTATIRPSLLILQQHLHEKQVYLFLGMFS